MNATDYPRLTADENDLLRHVMMWGSDGYPIEKRGRQWWVRDWRTVGGCPKSFNTKREAVAHFEVYHQMLIDRAAGRI